MTLPVFDCLVLSGGGAKGSYGAGAAYALYAYYDFKKIVRSLCFVGTSAGALNAGVLASYDPERLKSLWLTSASDRTILGKNRPNLNREVFRKLAGSFFRGKLSKQQPFAVFQSMNLKGLISENVDFEGLKDRSLIILTTDFTSGDLKAFYCSKLIDNFVAYDRALLIEQQRLAHFEKIENKEQLVSAMLASAAIPVFFPPVKIGADYYVDGGVGNNTPTREAAYFLRFLNKLKMGEPGDVYCIRQDPPTITGDDQQELKFGEILKRTTELAQYIHIQPIIDAWERINRETQELEQAMQGFVDWINSTNYEKAVITEVIKQASERLGASGGATKRLDVQLITVQPSTPLGDTLDFSSDAMKQNLRRGYVDMLTSLETLARINNVEYQELINRPLA
jgi:predicted patatin/cPLA2 family phospholipase